jgi:hypothetical protein
MTHRSLLPKFLLLLLILTLPLVSCDSGGSNDDKDEERFWPLEEGNTWTYNDRETYSDDRPDATGNYKITVLSVERRNDEVIASVRGEDPDGSETDTFEIREEENGYWVDNQMFYNTELPSGATYTVETADEFEVEVEVQTSTVSVPAGSFTGRTYTYVLEYGGACSTFRETLVPGVGLVRQKDDYEQECEGATSTYLMELAEYDID